MDDVLDMSIVEELLSFADDGDPELLVDLIQMFLDDAPAKIKAITEGDAEADFEKLERAAHSLKGTSGNLGAHHLQNACEEMQLASRKHELGSVREITPRIVSAFAEADAALQKLLGSFSS